MCRRTRGYIFFETVVAMALLSMSALVIQGALRQAIITRGQAQDYTTARFLMEKIVGERAMRLPLPEGSGSGRFEAPHERFRYEWEVRRVTVPLPPVPTFPSAADPAAIEALLMEIEAQLQDYMGKLTVRIFWERAGMEFEHIGETLLRSELFWQPPPPEEETLP